MADHACLTVFCGGKWGPTSVLIRAFRALLPIPESTRSSAAFHARCSSRKTIHTHLGQLDPQHSCGFGRQGGGCDASGSASTREASSNQTPCSRTRGPEGVCRSGSRTQWDNRPVSTAITSTAIPAASPFSSVIESSASLAMSRFAGRRLAQAGVCALRRASASLDHRKHVGACKARADLELSPTHTLSIGRRSYLFERPNLTFSNDQLETTTCQLSNGKLLVEVAGW